MEKLTVLGAGLMGHSIALTAAWAKIEVVLQGIDQEDLDRADKGILSKLSILHANGLITQEDVGIIRDRIHFSVSVESAVEHATFVIEAIPENLQLKQDYYKNLDRLCGKDVVLASNTSGLSPTAIARDMDHPNRMVVTHFWNPAHLMPLVEVVRGERTDDGTIARSMELLRQMNKKPIEVKKDIPGFVGNRLQYALFREAQHILEEGVATEEDIDQAVVYSIGRRLPITGPFMTADMGGLEVFDSISNYLFEDLSKEEKSLRTMRKHVDNGHYGQKNGQGFYKWTPELSERMSQLREKELIRYLIEDRKSDSD